jgi:hypothetical protein
MEDDGLDNVDAGHILAHHLGGPGNEPINIFPQSLHYNRGSYSSQEGQIYDCLSAAKEGSYATLHWEFYYNDTTSTQPHEVLYQADFSDSEGCSSISTVFPNTYYG